MNLEITGRHTILTAKLREQARVGLDRIGLVTNRCTNAHVILTEDKYRRIAEVSVQCRGDVLVATCEGTEMDSALHDALHKVEQQAVRLKEKAVAVRERGAKPLAV
jgi:putative sigma-54 modulation protein